MNEYDVKRLGLILAIQAEIEGLKSENTRRALVGMSPTYQESIFHEMAERLRCVANCHNDQL